MIALIICQKIVVVQKMVEYFSTETQDVLLESYSYEIQEILTMFGSAGARFR